MATDFVFGSIPTLYREIYDTICPNQDPIPHDLFLELFVCTDLEKRILAQVWEYSSSQHATLTRNGLYKALALIALAQQGKSLHEKLLESYIDQELPKPKVGSLIQLATLSLKIKRQQNPTVLGYTYKELCQLDAVEIHIVPEKKGLILKHLEYEVRSIRLNSTVMRRYNDFVALHEILLLRFPYRMIPRLPPKKLVGVNLHFLEERRKALCAFMNNLVRHPSIYDDSTIKYFLTFAGSDMQNKMKDQFRSWPDEFMMCSHAAQLQSLVPTNAHAEMILARSQFSLLLDAFLRIYQVCQRIVTNALTYATDMDILAKELESIGSEPTAHSSWASGSSDVFTRIKQGFRAVSGKFGGLGSNSETRSAVISDDVVHSLRSITSTLQAHKDLCIRLEKGVVSDHQKALVKLGLLRKKKTSFSNDDLEETILKQWNEISNMENRNLYSLHCIQMETQLVHANLVATVLAMKSLANHESAAHHKLCLCWNQLYPFLENIIPADLYASSAQTRSSNNNVKYI